MTVTGTSCWLCRHQSIAQELYNRQLPPVLQRTHLELNRVGARHLRELQALRARQLVELQSMELAHATANGERGIKMAESRHEMELAHFSARCFNTCDALFWLCACRTW
jgi:DNA-binding FadR family transcriptional regulator